MFRAPPHPPSGTFVRVPLDLRDPHGLAALAAIMCVIPGTVWSELSLDRGALLLHVFDLERRGRVHRAPQVPLREAPHGDLRMSPLLYGASAVALVCLVLAMACAVVRLFRGPSAQDRVLALDALYICGMLVMLVLGIRYTSEMFFEAALLIALFGFVGSASMAKFLLRGEVIE